VPRPEKIIGGFNSVAPAPIGCGREWGSSAKT